ncbi:MULTISPECIES: ABC transporter ATP-binding protein [Aerococcus]|uniref:ABC transporter ATP-binding protein n=1 Tax=Aerococcus TaxID=1375 RepID=UPI000DCD3580|nr:MULTISPECIES: ABC transporter ATP-binding protein [Aerococcus]KAA9297513.1 ABC transporter ATP-binding protein [Aerococcus tenax]MDK6688177.1 ABC transporter ATP-binding protein [Aerococcus urinae]MDK8132703.1 ABC transporter ATP-binding protein [Aerococcus urinae]MDK8484376.1 ABC transporter ATP-binding protein [Aerococcus urinae]MDL5179341.1 ABC transporter ATP-binding protein [Aerococcus tenax]
MTDQMTITQLSKAYGNNVALNNISVSFNKGEFIAILGPSGCGKTTFLRSIAGFLTPDAGTIQLGDKLLYQEGENVPVEERGFGMVFQHFALWPHLSVFEHLLYPLNSSVLKNKLSKEEKKKRIHQTLDMLQLQELKNRYPHELSGGQKQRVSLGRALVSGPNVLLMDEPLSALDAHLKDSMIHEIKKIHQTVGSTFLYVTHDQLEAMALADRIVVMNNGEISQMDTPYNLYHFPTNDFVAQFIGRSSIVKGTWNKGAFTPENGVRTIWEPKKIANYFVEHNIYPVKPEEFILNKQEKGIPGIVTDKQFMGKYIKYLVQFKYEKEMVVEVISSNDYINVNVNDLVFLDAE